MHSFNKISNPCIKSLPRTKMLLVLLLACEELLISAPNIITFSTSPPLGCEKPPLESNPIPYPEFCMYQHQYFLLI